MLALRPALLLSLACWASLPAQDREALARLAARPRLEAYEARAACRLLAHPDAALRNRAAGVLRAHPECADAVLPQLLALRRDADPAVAAVAGYVLAALGPQASPPPGELARLLADTRSPGHAERLRQLAEHPEQALPVLPQLAQQSHEPAVLEVLHRLGRHDAAATAAALATALPELVEPRQAIALLRELLPDGGPHLDTLAQSLHRASVRGDRAALGEAARSLGAALRTRSEVAALLLPELTDLPADQRQTVLNGCYDVGPNGALLWPTLRSWLPGRNECQTVAQMLLHFGPEADALVPDLLAVLPEVDAFTSSILGLAAAQLPGTHGAAPALVRHLTHRDADAVRRLLFALGVLARDQDDAAAAVLTALRRPEPGVRLAAVHALGRLRAFTQQHLPELDAAADDADAEVARTARAVRRTFAADLAPAELLAMLTAGDLGVALVACDALVEHPADATDTAHALARLLAAAGDRAAPGADTDPVEPWLRAFVQRAVAERLRALGPAAAPAVPALESALPGMQPQTLRAALAVLTVAGPAGERLLVRLLTHRWLRLPALVALGGADEASPALRRDLAACVHAPDPYERAAAVRALARHAGWSALPAALLAPDAFAAFARAAGEPGRSQVRRLAFVLDLQQPRCLRLPVLEQLRYASTSLLAADRRLLVPLLGDDDPSLRAAAADLLTGTSAALFDDDGHLLPAAFAVWVGGERDSRLLVSALLRADGAVPLPDPVLRAILELGSPALLHSAMASLRHPRAKIAPLVLQTLFAGEPLAIMTAAELLRQHPETIETVLPELLAAVRRGVLAATTAAPLLLACRAGRLALLHDPELGVPGGDLLEVATSSGIDLPTFAPLAARLLRQVDPVQFAVHDDGTVRTVAGWLTAVPHGAAADGATLGAQARRLWQQVVPAARPGLLPLLAALGPDAAFARGELRALLDAADLTTAAGAAEALLAQGEAAAVQSCLRPRLLPDPGLLVRTVTPYPRLAALLADALAATLEDAPPQPFLATLPCILALQAHLTPVVRGRLLLRLLALHEQAPTAAVLPLAGVDELVRGADPAALVVAADAVERLLAQPASAAIANQLAVPLLPLLPERLWRCVTSGTLPARTFAAALQKARQPLPPALAAPLLDSALHDPGLVADAAPLLQPHVSALLPPLHDALAATPPPAGLGPLCHALGSATAPLLPQLAAAATAADAEADVAPWAARIAASGVDGIAWLTRHATERPCFRAALLAALDLPDRATVLAAARAQYALRQPGAGAALDGAVLRAGDDEELRGELLLARLAGPDPIPSAVWLALPTSLPGPVLARALRDLGDHPSDDPFLAGVAAECLDSPDAATADAAAALLLCRPTWTAAARAPLRTHLGRCRDPQLRARLQAAVEPRR